MFSGGSISKGGGGLLDDSRRIGGGVVVGINRKIARASGQINDHSVRIFPSTFTRRVSLLITSLIGLPFLTAIFVFTF